MKTAVEPLILGHNQFIGVDHLDQARGAQRENEFANSERIVELVRYSYSSGVRGLMVSTHARLKALMSALRADNEMRRGLGIYPIVPYAAGYVRRSNEVGLVTMAKEALRGTGVNSKMGMAYNALMGFLSGNPDRFVGPLVATELAPFRGLRVDAVILHNVLTDLLLAWNAKSTFEHYSRVIIKKFGVRPAFATFNYPLLAKRFSDWDLPRPLVLTSFNPLGFQMNPSKEACERELALDRADVIGMSVLAAGRVPLAMAADYVKGQQNLRSVVFGSSSPHHVLSAAKAFGNAVGKRA